MTARSLEHDPEKWKPVFRKDHAQTKRWDHDAIPLDRIMIWSSRAGANQMLWNPIHALTLAKQYSKIL
jgi:hypothetical protein